MPRLTPRRFRLYRKLLLVLAAAPLFQFTQCQTFTNQVLGSVANSLPATLFSILQSALLAPLLALLTGGSGTTGGTGGTGTGI